MASVDESSTFLSGRRPSLGTIERLSSRSCGSRSPSLTSCSTLCSSSMSLLPPTSPQQPGSNDAVLALGFAATATCACRSSTRPRPCDRRRERPPSTSGRYRACRARGLARLDGVSLGRRRWERALALECGVRRAGSSLTSSLPRPTTARSYPLAVRRPPESHAQRVERATPLCAAIGHRLLRTGEGLARRAIVPSSVLAELCAPLFSLFCCQLEPVHLADSTTVDRRRHLHLEPPRPPPHRPPPPRTPPSRPRLSRPFFASATAPHPSLPLSHHSHHSPA